MPSSSFWWAQNPCAHLARAMQRNKAGVLWSLFNHALITLASWRKLLLYLFLSLWFFPWAFGGGEKTQQTVSMNRKAVTGRQFREGSRGLEDSVFLLPQVGGRGLAQMPSWWGGSSHSCEFLLLCLRDPSRATQALGRAWGYVQVRVEK